MPEYLIGPNGKIVKVSVDGELFTHSRTNEAMGYINQHDGKVWSMPFDAVDPTDADDYFGYIKNDSKDEDLHLRHFNFHSTVAGFLEIQRVTGTSVNGTSVTLVEENSRFAEETPEGTFESGVNITGLTDGGVHEFIYLEANKWMAHTIAHDIILGRNGSVGLLWTVSTGILTGVVKFYSHSPLEE